MYSFEQMLMVIVFLYGYENLWHGMQLIEIPMLQSPFLCSYNIYTI